MRYPCHCVRCGHDWSARIPRPTECSLCGGSTWDRPRSYGIDVFNQLVVIERDECIVWPRSKIGGGYGRFQLDGNTVLAHRLAYERRVGQIPEGLQVLHRCDNPPCMNYRHLLAGTNEENKDDKIAKHRHRFGATNSTAKLTDVLVRQIRMQYVFGSATHGTFALARQYGVHQSTIYNIIRRKTWSHI